MSIITTFMSNAIDYDCLTVINILSTYLWTRVVICVVLYCLDEEGHVV